MQSTSSESKVLQIFESLRQAMLSNDAETLRSHIAEDYHGSDAGGRAHGRDEFLAAYGHGGVTLTTFEVSDINTVAWTDTVLVSGIVELRGAYEDQQFEHRSRFLDVYRQQDGTWQLVASSVTDIARRINAPS
jgi:ketosteroid isomerase-like protein